MWKVKSEKDLGGFEHNLGPKATNSWFPNHVMKQMVGPPVRVHPCIQHGLSRLHKFNVEHIWYDIQRSVGLAYF